MDNIEYYKFLASLHLAGISSYNQNKYLLLKSFPNLSQSEADTVLNSFSNNHNEIVKNLNNITSNNWDIAWQNVKINDFILNSPQFEHFDKDILSSKFNLSPEETIHIMTSCFVNFQTNYAAVIINKQLEQIENELD